MFLRLLLLIYLFSGLLNLYVILFFLFNFKFTSYSIPWLYFRSLLPRLYLSLFFLYISSTLQCFLYFLFFKIFTKHRANIRSIISLLLKSIFLVSHVSCSHQLPRVGSHSLVLFILFIGRCYLHCPRSRYQFSSNKEEKKKRCWMDRWRSFGEALNLFLKDWQETNIDWMHYPLSLTN